MTPARLHATDQPGRLRLEGAVEIATVRSLWQQSGQLLPRPDRVVIDLGGVTRADSAGLALLIHWTREQRHHGGSVEFVNIPEQMQAIARVSGVDTILPLQRA